MRFLTLIVALMASLAAASPVHYKRELGGVLLCTGANSTGTCTHVVAPLSSVGVLRCQQLEAPFFESTATFAPDGEDFECFPRLYSCGGTCRSPTGCTFGAVDFAYENKYDLGKIGWDKLIQSFDCALKKGV
ncbi:hypothetical protein NLU13_2728 [Sarocladium strictum]|uniref:Uncharacterized protein n=1 Tax=Sarocladium strictum TaxID=5046 RepID=A0AA39GKP0_SARSR|nr:hypothetical protein NLU13_2728 [Sarocladium strictum]